MEIKDIKQKIRELRKLKKQLRSGTPERISLHRQIQALKQQFAEVSIPEPLKEPIIAEILRIEAERKTIPTFEQLGISLSGYSIENLKIHLAKLKRIKNV